MILRYFVMSRFSNDFALLLAFVNLDLYTLYGSVIGQSIL